MALPTIIRWSFICVIVALVITQFVFLSTLRRQYSYRYYPGGILILNGFLEANVTTTPIGSPTGIAPLFPFSIELDCAVLLNTYNQTCALPTPWRTQQLHIFQTYGANYIYAYTALPVEVPSTTLCLHYPGLAMDLREDVCTLIFPGSATSVLVQANSTSPLYCTAWPQTLVYASPVTRALAASVNGRCQDFITLCQGISQGDGNIPQYVGPYVVTIFGGPVRIYNNYNVFYIALSQLSHSSDVDQQFELTVTDNAGTTITFVSDGTSLVSYSSVGPAPFAYGSIESNGVYYAPNPQSENVYDYMALYQCYDPVVASTVFLPAFYMCFGIYWDAPTILKGVVPFSSLSDTVVTLAEDPSHAVTLNASISATASGQFTVSFYAQATAFFPAAQHAFSFVMANNNGAWTTPTGSMTGDIMYQSVPGPNFVITATPVSSPVCGPTTTTTTTTTTTAPYSAVFCLSLSWRNYEIMVPSGVGNGCVRLVSGAAPVNVLAGGLSGLPVNLNLLGDWSTAQVVQHYTGYSYVIGVDVISGLIFSVATSNVIFGGLLVDYNSEGTVDHNIWYSNQVTWNNDAAYYTLRTGTDDLVPAVVF